MSIKRAASILLRPWVDGSVTFAEWCEAFDTIYGTLAPQPENVGSKRSDTA